jgi:hypothetical protein
MRRGLMNEVSCRGLVPMWSLAEQTGLTGLLERVRFRTSKVRSGAVNPAGKLACVIAGMTAGAHCIDELDVIRCGGMTSLFDGSTLPRGLLRRWRARSGRLGRCVVALVECQYRGPASRGFAFHRM